MEPSTELTTTATALTPAPDVTVERLTTDVAGILDRAMLEQLSRTEPVAFLKFASTLLGLRARPGEGRTSTVVNVVNAIPRSPLDGMPPGFTYK